MADRFAEPLPDSLEHPEMPPGSRWFDAVTRYWRLDADEWAKAEHIARAKDELARLEEAADDAPPTVKGSMGQPVANPLFAEVRAHRRSVSDLVKTLELPSEYDELMRAAKLQAAQDPRRPGRPTRAETRSAHNFALNRAIGAGDPS
ncbi:hypothetical protein SSP35_15_00770 [Streptomyces sp. NBRC 110611]|uniref:hypothetical protein n=1 Tax=Streptomyces sp. NBRC 110611 TaxID=1621259 RepID=UPI000855B45B|nr:hypothetical protein [Streptomyces sp. NBRC 110611]GAU69922.1 hypothetical protein SSP35_15_00770 [Streptomyces sp. NBRC 110611]